MRGGRSSNAISRRAAMKFARGFYKGKLRSRVVTQPLGLRLCMIECGDKVLGQGYSWETAYMNLRANLPKRQNGETNWLVLDAERGK